MFAVKAQRPKPAAVHVSHSRPEWWTVIIAFSVLGLWITTHSAPPQTSKDFRECVLTLSGAWVGVCMYMHGGVCAHAHTIGTFTYICTHYTHTHTLTRHTYKDTECICCTELAQCSWTRESQGLQSAGWSTGEPTLWFQSESLSQRLEEAQHPAQQQAGESACSRSPALCRLSSSTCGRPTHTEQGRLQCPVYWPTVHLVHKHLTDTPRTKFDQMSGHPAAQSNSQRKQTIISYLHL